MNSGIRIKLSIMMFLQFFIWGAWLPKIYGYMDKILKFNEYQIPLVLNAFAIAALVGLFFMNQFADRNFAAEKFLAVCHLIGGLAILAIWAFDVKDFFTFFTLMLIHSLFYVPTISVTNSIAFANLKEPQKEFGPIRVLGTIGWIAASWPFVFLLAGDTSNSRVSTIFAVAGIASLVLAAFSLTLPHTPPKPAKPDEPKFALTESLKLLAIPFVLILFIVTFFDATVHQCYFLLTEQYFQKIGIPANWVMPAMSVGQIAEIATMAILGYVLKNLGWRTTMILGICGHVVRFAVFALVPTVSVAIAANVLHGICYAFFFATVYIFVDEFFPKASRTSAQGLFNALIIGIGPLVGNIATPYMTTVFKVGDGTANYRIIFLILSGTAAFAAILLLLFFHPPKIAVPKEVGH